MANVTVTIRTEDSGAVAIDSVDAHIFDGAGVFVTSGITGTPPGEVDFLLPGDGPGIPYTVRLFKVDVSFLPQPEFSILVTDPPNPNNFFTFVGTLGLQGQLVKLVVQDDATPTPNPLAAVRIHLFDAADLFQTELKTDVNGEVELVLDGAPDPGLTYFVRLGLSGFTFTLGPTQLIKVHDPLVSPNTNIFDFEATQNTVPVTADPDMCLMSGFFSDTALRPMKDLELTFHPREGYPKNVVSGFPFSGEPTIIRNRIVGSPARFRTDKTGYVEVLLPREGIFDVHIAGLEASDLTLLAAIRVPDLAGINIHDVLFPYITQVDYSTGTIDIAVDGTLDIDATLTSSNLQPELEGKGVLVTLLDFTTADETIAIVEITVDGKLRITGIAAGSTTLDVVRKEGTLAPRRPAVSALIVTPPTITVT